MRLSTPRHLFAAALLFLPAAVPKTPATAPKSTAAVPEGKLEIRLLITEQPERVLHPTKAADGTYPQAAPVTVAPRGKLLVGLVFFKNCKPDAHGNCNVDMDVQGSLPNGTLFENGKGKDLWRNAKAPHAGFAQVGHANIKIQIEAKDPAGVYKVVAVAHDHNNGAESRSEVSFMVQ